MTIKFGYVKKKTRNYLRVFRLLYILAAKAPPPIDNGITGIGSEGAVKAIQPVITAQPQLTPRAHAIPPTIAGLSSRIHVIMKPM